MVISQLAGSQHITWTKLWPEPKAWAGFGLWWPKAQAWILLGPTQAEPGQAEPAHHYLANALFHLYFMYCLEISKSFLYVTEY